MWAGHTCRLSWQGGADDGAMVSFSQQSGLPWDQAIEQRPAAGAHDPGGKLALRFVYQSGNTGS